MDRGELDSYKATKIAEVIAPLSDEVCAQVDTALADRLAGKDPTQIRRIARDLVHRFDEAGANERAERRREDRKLELCHEEDANDPTSIWRTVFTDPTTGTIRDVGRTRRRPPAALAELIRVRDWECRMPACHRPAHHTDLDHATPWRTGGKTNATNLHSLCRRHNLLKEQPGWRFHHNPETGELTITTPAGRTHHTSPTGVEKTDAR